MWKGQGREKDLESAGRMGKRGCRGSVGPGEKKPIDLDGLEGALLNVDGAYDATDDVCTHDGAPLAHGTCAGEESTCPRHGARCNVKTGAALCMPATDEELWARVGKATEAWWVRGVALPFIPTHIREQATQSIETCLILARQYLAEKL